LSPNRRRGWATVANRSAAGSSEFVIALTALASSLAYIDLSWTDLTMPASDWRLNRIERILFRAAIALAIVIVAVRVGAMATLWFLHH
jgi:hypothetical protein